MIDESGARHAMRLAMAAVESTGTGELIKFEEPPMSIDAENVMNQVSENEDAFEGLHSDCEDHPCEDCESTAIDRAMDRAQHEEFLRRKQ